MVSRTLIGSLNSAKGVVEVKVDTYGTLYISEKVREIYENGYSTTATFEIPVKHVDEFLDMVANAAILSDTNKKVNLEKEISRYEKMISDATENLRKLQLELALKKENLK